MESSGVSAVMFAMGLKKVAAFYVEAARNDLQR